MFDNEGSVDPADLARAHEGRERGDPLWWKAAGYTSRYGVEALERMQRAVDGSALLFVDFRGRGGPGDDSSVLVGRAAGPIRIVTVPDAEGSAGAALGVRNYKCISITAARAMPLDPVLAALRPQQATFTAWPIAARRVHALYEGSPLPREVSALTPGQVEALCFEYMRRGDPDLKLLLPVGRTLPDVDIYAWLPTGERIAAQVTHAGSGGDTVRNKAARLAAVRSAEKRVLFAGESAVQAVRSQVERDSPGVRLVTVEEVFAEVARSAPGFVEAMLAAAR